MEKENIPEKDSELNNILSTGNNEPCEETEYLILKKIDQRKNEYQALKKILDNLNNPSTNKKSKNKT